MVEYEVIESGSKGNGVIYWHDLLVDCGLPYARLEPYIAKGIKAILLTHEHGDHYEESSISTIIKRHPNIMWFVPTYLAERFNRLVKPHTLITYVEYRKKYRWGTYIIETIMLYHDVENMGYKIHKRENRKIEKVLHATDTNMLSHIEAKDYDLYALEANYDDDLINATIKEKINDGAFAYEIRAKDQHMSFEKTMQFFIENSGENSSLQLLHVSSKYDNETIDKLINKHLLR